MFLIVRSFKRETKLNTRNVLLCDTISVLHVDVCGRDYIRCVSLNRHASRVYKQIWSRWVPHASIIQLNRLLLFAAKTHTNLLRDRNQPNMCYPMRFYWVCICVMLVSWLYALWTETSHEIVTIPPVIRVGQSRYFCTLQLC